MVIAQAHKTNATPEFRLAQNASDKGRRGASNVGETAAAASNNGSSNNSDFFTVVKHAGQCVSLITLLRFKAHVQWQISTCFLRVY